MAPGKPAPVSIYVHNGSDEWKAVGVQSLNIYYI